MLIAQDTLDKFKRILDAIEWAFPGSRPVIGGGALRDSILGRQPKDVDVFIRFAGYQTLDSSLTRLVPCPTISQSYGRADMHGAWDFLQDIEGFPVQLILADFKSHVDLAHTFDLNLSRITYDGTYVYTTADFMRGAKDKTFRICRADNAYEIARSVRRIERLRSEKFSGYAYEPINADIIRARVAVPNHEATCVWCKTPSPFESFRNTKSVTEYGISGFCQVCQDGVFGAD